MTRLIGFLLGLVLGVAMAVMISGVDRSQLQDAITERLPESLRGLIAADGIVQTGRGAATGDRGDVQQQSAETEEPEALDAVAPGPESTPAAEPAAAADPDPRIEPAETTGPRGALAELSSPPPIAERESEDPLANVATGSASMHAAGEPRSATTADPADSEHETDGPVSNSTLEQSIWRPFRSERSAQGFADLLAERTNTDLQVRRDAPGVYQVVVTAATDTELAAAVSRLQAAGGLVAQEMTP